MAGGNSTTHIPVEAYYFERPEHSAGVDRLIFALDGVCKSLAAWEGHTRNQDEVERICNLAGAAEILSHQLMMRISSKPLSKRQSEATRRHQAEWRAQQARLAGPAEGVA